MKVCTYANFVLMYVDILITGTACPSEATEFNEKCFLMKDQFLSFHDANIECQRIPSGHLASFHSLSEYETLSGKLGLLR